MLNFHSIILIVHVLISASIIGLVLLQRGKGADAGAAFGAGASGTVFGARGSSNFLSRATGVLATLFFATSLGLAYLGSRQAPTESLMDLAPPVREDVSSISPLPLEEADGLDPAGGNTAPGVGGGDLPALPENDLATAGALPVVPDAAPAEDSNP